MMPLQRFPNPLEDRDVCLVHLPGVASYQGVRRELSPLAGAHVLLEKGRIPHPQDEY